MQINRQQLSLLKRFRIHITAQDTDRVVKLMMLTKNLANRQKVIGIISKMKDGSKLLRMAKIFIEDFDKSKNPDQEFAAQVALNRALELGEDFQKQASQTMAMKWVEIENLSWRSFLKDTIKRLWYVIQKHSPYKKWEIKGITKNGVLVLISPTGRKFDIGGLPMSNCPVVQGRLSLTIDYKGFTVDIGQMNPEDLAYAIYSQAILKEFQKQKQASQKDDLLDNIVVQAKNDEKAYERQDAKRAVDNAWADYVRLLLKGNVSREEINRLNKLFVSFVKRDAIRQVAQIWKEEESDPYLNEF